MWSDQHPFLVLPVWSCAFDGQQVSKPFIPFDVKRHKGRGIVKDFGNSAVRIEIITSKGKIR